MERLKNKKLFLLDMDGTLYIDNTLFAGCLDFLDAIKRNAGRYVFVTNNSSKGVDDYIKKLRGMGIEATENDFSTSSQATADYLLTRHPHDKVYVLGTESLKDEMRKHRINIVDRYRQDITCLAVGFDRELTFSKLEDACRILCGDVDYIATNPDIVCPTAFGYVPDCGSICEMLYNATKKKPTVIGKPSAAMVDYSMRKTGFNKEQTVVIGDRLYTDIQCAINAGVSSVLVLTGETNREMAETSSVKPDIIVRSVGELAEFM